MDTRRQVIETLLRRRRPDLANVVASTIRDRPFRPDFYVRVTADEQEAPDQYRERTGRCPRGYGFDGERCLERAPEKRTEPAAEPPQKGAETQPKGKGKAEPRKAAKPKPAPTEPRQDYGLDESVKSVTTLAELIEQHGGVKQALGHLGLSKMPPPKVAPTTVKIDLSGDVDGHAVMSWRDAKGRVQSSYTQRFLKRNAAVKWERVKKLADKADKAATTFKQTMRDAKASDRERDAAAVMSIIATTGLRPGSAAGIKATGHRGISTLAPDNVKVEGDRVTLDFIGKSGKRNLTTFSDPAIAAYLKQRVAAGDDPIFRSTAQDIGGVMKRSGVDKFKPKDFRTLRAGKLAAESLAQLDAPPPPLPPSEKKARALLEQKIKQASKIVADNLNNTPAVARSSYINPAIIQGWLKQVGGEKLIAAARDHDLAWRVRAAVPTADAIWNAAMNVTLPGHDQPVKADDDEDEQLDAAPIPL
jgi:DNA topoisomerase-1